MKEASDIKSEENRPTLKLNFNVRGLLHAFPAIVFDGSCVFVCNICV